MKPQKQVLSERKRLRLLQEWGNTPAANPFYRGKTPVEVVRLLLKPKKAKIWDA